MIALIAGALVLVGSLTAGRSYLWCSMMEQAVEACCCEPAHEDGDDGGAPQIHPGCCEDHAIADLDKARVGADAPDLPDALPAAIAPPAITIVAARAADRVASVRAAAILGRARPIRAGPRTAAENAVRLQVFRC